MRELAWELTSSWSLAHVEWWFRAAVQTPFWVAAAGYRWLPLAAASVGEFPDRIFQNTLHDVGTIFRKPAAVFVPECQKKLYAYMKRDLGFKEFISDRAKHIP